ncbi:MAG: hypothetical protein VYA34_08300 [Myxococcota bacterium]|nr:hypothetical protein [Myxococcota bacterium]
MSSITAPTPAMFLFTWDEEDLGAVWLRGYAVEPRLSRNVDTLAFPIVDVKPNSDFIAICEQVNANSL